MRISTQSLVAILIALGLSPVLISKLNSSAQTDDTSKAKVVAPDTKSQPTTPSEPKVDFWNQQSLSLPLDSIDKITTTVFLQNSGTVPAKLQFFVVLKGSDDRQLRKEVAIIRPTDPKEADPQEQRETIEALEIKPFRLELTLPSDVQPPLMGYLAVKATGEVKKEETAGAGEGVKAGSPKQPSTKAKKAKNVPAVTPAETPKDSQPKRVEKVAYLQAKLGPPILSQYPNWLVLFALAFAVLVAGLSYLPLARKYKLADRMGLPQWEFNKSWASNLTIVGALLTSILGFTALPEQTQHLNKTTYTTLSFLFGTLIVIAPMVYNLARRQDKKGEAPDGSGYEQQGVVGFFLLASSVTLWGVFGQTATLFFLLDELRKARLMSVLALSAFQGLIGLVLLLLIIYAYRTIEWTVESQRIKPVKARREALTLKAALSVPEAEALRNLQQPKWSLL